MIFLLGLQSNMFLNFFVAITELPNPSIFESWGTWLWSIALVAIGLGFVIFVHELGHFLAAKFFGVKCDKFYVGFDVPIRLGPIRLPAKLVHFKWGETEYGIGAIPLGGYVKMLGQDDDPRRAEEEAQRIREQAESDGVKLTKDGLDPRSYPAKPVYARMVIISAGVIMNLIFGAIFAAGAFLWGVPYDPCVVGNVIPGDPAWVQGLKPGDRILSVSADREPSRDLRFDDMRQEVVMHGFSSPEQPIPILIERDGQQIQVPIKGVIKSGDERRLMTVGIVNSFTTKLSSSRVFSRDVQFDAEQNPEVFELPDFHLGEKIIAINGEPLSNYENQEAPAVFELMRRLSPKFDQAVTVTVESVPEKDQQPTTREVTWKPIPRRTVGIKFGVGPISQIQKGSFAEAAKVGLADRPVMLNDQPIEDGAVLPLQVAKLAGQTAKLTLKRMSNDQEELYDFTWQVPEQFVFSATDAGSVGVSGYELPGSGLVVSILREVGGVVEGSAAAAAGLRPGDQLRQIQIARQTDPKLRALFDEKLKATDSFYAGQDLDGIHNALYVNEQIQTMPVGTLIKFQFERDKKMEEATLAVQVDEQWMSPDRGVEFSKMSGVFSEKSLAAAAGFGVKEVGRQMKNVVRFLYMLVTNKVQINMLGGPGMIFLAAQHEANEGPTRLLLFLTMLSANLAIINFLPIPALDGGHMMFLTYEAIFRKPVDENLQMKLTMGGVLCLLSLMVFVIVNDVLNITKMLS